MIVVFRVDVSTQIGSGHLMRCLTLAKQIEKEKKAQIAFISRNLDGNMNFLIEQAGYTLFALPECENNSSLSGYEKWLTVEKKLDAEQTKAILQEICADCLVIDSYALDEEWERIQRPFVKKIMVIDDLANRRHDCDILLDQNYYKDIKTRYEGLVPKHCKLLLGPKHALLRDEFYEERKHLRTRDGSIHRILVFFGGSDLTNETIKAVQAIVASGREDVQVDVVVGGSNKRKEEVERFCRQHKNMNYYCQVSNMAELIHKADLAIGAGGTTIWERCFLGLPSIVIAVADNQKKLCTDCNELGLLKYIGESRKATVDLLQKVLDEMIDNKKYIEQISSNIKLTFNNMNEDSFKDLFVT